MPDAAIHPSTQDLSAFGLGKLPDAAAAVVASHLETCATCQKAVENLPPDSFMGKLQAAKPNGSTSMPAAATGRAGISLSALGSPAAPPPGLPPELVNHPKYSIVRKLGQGGMGVVYQAVQTMMDRAVAIKVINPSMLENLEALPRFQSEVKAAAKLDYPNIVRAYDADQVGNLHLLVMEFVEGVSLAQMVKSKGPLPIGTACHFIRQVALGLQHAFERDMVHRDIKPANLMVTPKNQVKILDFGLARMRSERKKGAGLTQMDAFMGTPEYVSPEQATDARSADIRADIYSLGCTFYFLLTGRPPFQADTILKVLMSQIEKEPQPVRELRMAIPESLSSIVSKMLAKDPLQRYQKPVEVAQALAPIIKLYGKQKPTGVEAPPAPTTASSERPTRIAADTSRVNDLSKLTRRSASEAANRAAQESPFAGLRDDGAPKPKEPAKTPSVAAKPVWQRLAVVTAISTATLGTLLLILLAGGAFRVKTKDSMIVLENLPADADVLVDGSTVTVKSGNGNTFEVRVYPNKKHRLQIKKEGFSVFGEEVEVESGGRQLVVVRLVPLPKIPEIPPHPNDDSLDKSANVKSGSSSDSPDRIAISNRKDVWVIDGDTLSMKIKASWGNRILFGSPDWTDYTFSYEVMKLDDDEPFGAGGLFHAVDLDTRYDFFYGGYAKGEWASLGWFVAGNEHLARDNDDASALCKKIKPMTSNTWHRFEITVNGGEITCRMNGVKYISYKDDTLKSGRVGFRTSPGRFKFKNVKVVDPTGKVLWDGLPQVPDAKDSASRSAPDNGATAAVQDSAFGGAHVSKVFGRSIRTNFYNHRANLVHCCYLGSPICPITIFRFEARQLAERSVSRQFSITLPPDFSINSGLATTATRAMT